MATVPQGNQGISVTFGNQGNVAGAIITSAGMISNQGNQGSMGPQGNQGQAISFPSQKKHWSIEFKKAHFLKRLWNKGHWVLETWYEYVSQTNQVVYPLYDVYKIHDDTRIFATEQEAICVQVLEQLEQ